MKQSSLPSLPASVRVGPFDYRIVDWSPADANANNAMGECYHSALRISLRADLLPAKKAQTLIHEILHAIWLVGSVDQAGDNEERLVTNLAHHLAQVIRDNPDLMLWLSAASRG